ncbi:hypothetical protein BKA62DRAFT_680611 [Auriculariales sp. MPI-PUGE-AT-0066]|nr:hypothetical protein BKA62DRAFT_680611 [Auriculariales sp. MPI-PUGE-AT-0066]
MPGAFFSAITIASVLYAGAAMAANSGSFKLLSYHVVGLQGLMPASKLIATRLAPYTIANIQEDIIDKVDTYAGDPHAHKMLFSVTLSSFTIIDFGRTKWDQCSLPDNCLAPKGWIWMRVQITDGAYFDLYHLNMNAGSDDDARAARQSNWAQVTAFALKYSQGMPLIIVGDTNSLYTSDTDGASIRSTVSTLGVTDAWVSVVHGGATPALGSAALTCPFPFAMGTSQSSMVACETVDKFLVRAGSTMSVFNPTEFTNENDAFLNDSGYPFVGGPHGMVFNYLGGALITSFTARGSDRLNAISYMAGGTTVNLGGPSGDTVTLDVTEDPIVSLRLCARRMDSNQFTRVTYLEATTRAGKVAQSGTVSGDCTLMSAPAVDWGLVGFWGRSDNVEVFRLGPVWGPLPLTQPASSTSPSPSDSPSNSVAPTHKHIPVVAIALPTAVGAALLAALSIWYLLRRRRRATNLVTTRSASLLRNDPYPFATPSPSFFPSESTVPSLSTLPSTRQDKLAPHFDPPRQYFPVSTYASPSSRRTLSEYTSFNTNTESGDEIIRAVHRAGLTTQALLHSLNQMVPDRRDVATRAPPGYA